MAIRGVFEPYEGLADFKTFADYLHGWIKPNILADLRTVFEGARQRWLDGKHPPGAPGRGDFIMAASLLSVFDHFGAFLARPVIEWITPAENIARVAKRIKPSVSDIYAIVANMGRNALAHGAWPQTAIVLDGADVPTVRFNDLAFGLSFNANDDPARHDTFHWKPYVYRPRFDLPAPRHVPEKTIKLVLNVHNLRQLLEDAVNSGVLFEHVSQDQFDRVRDIAVLMGDTRKDVTDAMRKRSRPQHWDKKHVRKVSRKSLCKQDTMVKQIDRLLAEAKWLGVPNTAEDEKTPRDYLLDGPR